MATSLISTLIPAMMGEIHKLMDGPDTDLLNVTTSEGHDGTLLQYQTFPTNVSSIMGLLFSFIDSSDWLKLIILGGLFEMLRRLAFACWAWAVGSFFITARFDEDDYSYDWIMSWLSKQPSWARARELQVSTGSVDALIRSGEDEDLVSEAGEKVSYLPTVEATYNVFYRRRWIRVRRLRNNTGYYGRAEDSLEIMIMTRNRKLLDELLVTAKQHYTSACSSRLCIYARETSINGGWRLVAARPKRSLRSIVLDPGIKDMLIEDAKDFLDSRAWYVERGIPFRRGYLLYGEPGSGKTSLIQGIAGELGLHIYIISLSRAGLDDASLNEMISSLPQKCIALMEDIDAAFHHGISREDEPAPPPPPPVGGSTSAAPSKPTALPSPSTSRVTLSGLLNALDGVGAQEGRILFATTNKFTALDPALCRPGRMDLHIEFKLASQLQAQELFKRFYLSVEDMGDEVGDDESEHGSVDSGYGGSPTSERPLIDLNRDEKSPSASSTPSSPATPSSPLDLDFTHQLHSARAPKLSRRQTLALAESFAQAVPDREVSMASLQGYLMVYKSRPFEAAKNIGLWIEEQRKEKAKKAKASPQQSTVS